MDNFVYEGLSTRVIFGVETLKGLPAEVSRLGSKALVLCTPHQRDEADEAARILGKLAVLFELEVTLGTPRKLSEIGMRYEDLDRAPDLASQNPYYNPRPSPETASGHCLKTHSPEAGPGGFKHALKGSGCC